MKHLSAYILILLFLGGLIGQAQAQGPSPTPVVIELPTQAALPTEITIATVTPTPTATSENPVSLLLNAESANVRILPDTEDGDIIGTLEPNANYTVTGRYFSWYQFFFDGSPNGRAWVYGDLVTIEGNQAAIPEIDPFATPTAPAGILATTPEANVTEDSASARSLDVETTGGDSGGLLGVLPTYTYPAEFSIDRRTPTPSGIILPTPTPDTVGEILTTFAEGNVPPIVPITLLAIGGLLGLFVSFLRR